MDDQWRIRIDGSQGSQVGDNNHMMNVWLPALPRPETVVAPPGTHNLPLPGTTLFVGRDSDLARLEELPAAAGHTLVGLGGIGKTELAVQYARSRLARYPLVWWLTADSLANLTYGLTALTRRLNTVAGLSDGPSWALSWLQTHPGWLLVFDDVENPVHLENLMGPLHGRGQVLVTTRRDLGADTWGRLGLALVRLGVLDRRESVDLLTRRMGGTDPDAAVLAEELGDLPLALEQAAAYIRQQGLTVAQYRELLAGDPEMYDLVAEGRPTERAVFRVWEITMGLIGDRDPVAAQMLSTVAYLAPDQLPEPVLAPLCGGRLDLAQTLNLLASYSMISRAGGFVSVHRLVQAIVRAHHHAGAGDLDEDAAGADPVHFACSLLAMALPADPANNPADWPEWAMLLPHIDAVAGRHPVGCEDLAFVLDRTATYLRWQGKFDPAVAMFEQARSDRMNLLGASDRATLESGHNLAAGYHSAGRLDEAIKAYETVLADCTRFLGDDDPLVLTTRINLSFAYHERGRTEATAMAERSLADHERVLGPREPRTLSARNILAVIYLQTGRAVAAVALFERLVTDSASILGADHPELIASRGNLAAAYARVGRPTEAIALAERVVADSRRVFGDQAPATLVARRDLVRYRGDLRALEEVVADSTRLFGAGHPLTRQARAYLAAARRESGVEGAAGDQEDMGDGPVE